MQTHGDQQTVEERIDAYADRAGAENPLAERDKACVNDRPDKEQDQVHDDCDKRGHDGHAALAAEKAERVGQFGVLEPIVAGGAD